MPSKDSVTKTIRIGKEDLEVVESLMESEGLSWSGAIHQIISERGTPQKTQKQASAKHNSLEGIMSEETYKDLEDMCRKSGVSLEVFFDRIRELWNEGRIYTEGFLIECRGGYDLKELEETCHRANVNVQDMIDRLSKSMLRG